MAHFPNEPSHFFLVEGTDGDEREEVEGEGAETVGAGDWSDDIVPSHTLSFVL